MVSGEKRHLGGLGNSDLPASTEAYFKILINSFSTTLPKGPIPALLSIIWWLMFPLTAYLWPCSHKDLYSPASELFVLPLPYQIFIFLSLVPRSWPCTLYMHSWRSHVKIMKQSKFVSKTFLSQFPLLSSGSFSHILVGPSSHLHHSSDSNYTELSVFRLPIFHSI